MISYRTLMNYFCVFVALPIGFFSATTNLRAGSINASQLPSIVMTVSGSPTEWNYSPPEASYKSIPDGSGYELSNVLHAYGVCDNTANVTVEQLQFNPDPFVLNNILVTNTTTSTQIFSVFVGLPTSFGAPNFISGNVRTSVIDGGLDGGTIATAAPTPIYQAQIDSTTVATLQNHPFSVVALAGGSNTASASFGPSVNFTPVNSDIGIQLRFSLTPGDTASILSRFDVVAVPEPTSLILFGGALAGIAGYRRRR
jgi:hypothetical protein